MTYKQVYYLMYIDITVLEKTEQSMNFVTFLNYMALIEITFTKISRKLFIIEKWSNDGKNYFSDETRLYIKQEFSWHDHRHLSTFLFRINWDKRT